MGPQFLEFMQTATRFLFLNLLSLSWEQRASRELKGREGLERWSATSPLQANSQTFGTRCSLHIKTYNPLYWSTLLCEIYPWGCRKKNSSRKYTKHLLLAFALKRNFRSCADYKKIKLSLIISDQQKAVKSQNGKKPHMTLLREPKIGLVSTRESRNIILLRMLSNNASSRQLRNSTQSSTNPALFFFKPSAPDTANEYF